jgi:CRP-like cAMP-binding protein
MRAAENFGAQANGSLRRVLLMPEIAHADLADMIGSSRPMVSRPIAAMTEEGVLLRQSKQCILLETLAGEESDSPSQPKEPTG